MAIFGSRKNNENVPEEPVNHAAPEEKAPSSEKELDFNRYFLADRRVILENVSYETNKPEQSANGYRLTGKDSVVAQLLGNTGVKVTYNRTLKFDPEGPFTISVSYAVMLVFNPGTRDEVDWKTVDIAAEFRKNCANLIAAISARISLLIGEITSASGQPPVIISVAPGQVPQQH